MATKTIELPSGHHAPLSASSAHRWMACTASAYEALKEEPRSSEAAAEGTAAHFVASESLIQNADPASWIGITIQVDGYEFEVDEEMVEAVAVHCDYVRSRVAEASGEVHVEVECDLTPALRDLHPDFGGMADTVIYYPDDKHLEVVDYKHGSGVWVASEDNPQLKYYALGALLRSGAPANQVTCTIVQPRCMADADAEVIRSWTFDTIDLIDFAADLQEAAEKAKTDPEYVVGDHCRFCPVRYRCPELQKHQELVLADDFDPVFQPPDPERLAKALDVFPLLEARIKQLRELAYEQAVQGNPPPGYKLVEKRAMRKWADEDEARRWAEKRFGDKAFTPPKLKSPAQLEKVAEGEDQQRIEEFVVRHSSGYTLVPESDNRPAAKLLSDDDFEDLTEDSP